MNSRYSHNIKEYKDKLFNSLINSDIMLWNKQRYIIKCNDNIYIKITGKLFKKYLLYSIVPIKRYIFICGEGRYIYYYEPQYLFTLSFKQSRQIIKLLKLNNFMNKNIKQHNNELKNNQEILFKAINYLDI